MGKRCGRRRERLEDSDLAVGQFARKFLFYRARWSGRSIFSAASTAWASALAPFYRVRSFSAAAGDAETGARAISAVSWARAVFSAAVGDALNPCVELTCKPSKGVYLNI